MARHTCSILLGDYYWAKFTQENFFRAKKHFEEAIAIDPNYALAYTGLANTYSALGVNGHMPLVEARPKSRAAAERAFELAPQLAETHLALGAYKMFFEWDLDAAEDHYKKAMELDSEYPVPHELLAYFAPRPWSARRGDRRSKTSKRDGIL
jgi:Tfp pilus assembly protein PilF